SGRPLRPRRLEPALRASRGDRLAPARGARLGAAAGARRQRRDRGDRNRRARRAAPGRLARPRGRRRRRGGDVRPARVATFSERQSLPGPRGARTSRGGTMGVVEQAVSAVKAGQLVVIPTDTVYGLAASPYREEPVRRMFRLKGKPETSPVALVAS